LNVCCVGFENKIKNALMDVLPGDHEQPAISKSTRNKR
jgi:hypothetical protein